MHRINGSFWISNDGGLPSCATPQHTAQQSCVRSSAHYVGEPEVSSTSVQGVPSCATPQHSHYWCNASLDEGNQAEASSASVQAVPSCATPQHSYRWGNACFDEEKQTSRSSARKRFGDESMGEVSSDYSKRRRAEGQQQQQQQQHRVALPAFSRPASAHSAKQRPPISDAVGVRRADYLRNVISSSEQKASRQLHPAIQGPSTETKLFGNVKMASSTPVDGQEVNSRKELLEEFLWQPDTPEEEALARQFIPCPFLRELGACDKVGCVFNHSGLAKPCHRQLGGFCTFGSACMYGHRTCGVQPDQYSDLAGWVKQESALAVKVNSLWKLKKVFV